MMCRFAESNKVPLLSSFTFTMNLLDLIVRLADPRSQDDFFIAHGVDTASEHLSI